MNFFLKIYHKIFFVPKLNISIKLNSFLEIEKLVINTESNDTLKFISHLYCNHRFDLLGTGWIQNSYKSESIGFDGTIYKMNVYINQYDTKGEWLNEILHPRHLKRGKHVWKKIDDMNYMPIDWQKDFKSGFRWSNKMWYKDCLKVVGRKEGVDIKIPWELGRMQHLPQMAISAIADEGKRNRLILEFRNQIYDFIATNPIKFGVNWACTMDVGIRAVNMLIAFDLFRQIDKSKILDAKFIEIFVNSIYQHGKHIVNNLEWNKVKRSNHYLSDIGGLLFISTYLKGNEEIDCWLAFSIQELVKEFKEQFNEDGSNWEGSTCYHRLSSEIVVYSTALILGLSIDKKKALRNYNNKYWRNKIKLNDKNDQDWSLENSQFFPNWYWLKLNKVSIFTKTITKHDFEIPQIGDNDSGRFIKLSPNGGFLKNEQVDEKFSNLGGYLKYIKNNFPEDNMYWDENNLNNQPLLSLLFGLYSSKEFENASHAFPIEQSFIQLLSKGVVFEKEIKESKQKVNKINYTNKKDLKYANKTTLFQEDNNKDSLLEGISFFNYNDFGLYIFKSKRLYLAVNGRNRTKEKIPHAHDDKLSFELQVDGRNVYVDPGSYIYSANIEKRNYFRSNKIHNGVNVNNMNQDKYQTDYANLFRLYDTAKCKIFDIKPNSISLLLEYKSIKVVRIFTIYNNSLVLETFCNNPFKENFTACEVYSNGYGKLCISDLNILN